ncbi:MAG: hypothetical protein LAT67_11170 [Balneolales bacterium]|nr:hypothetical protein [Balneolales bacterium]
MNILFGSASKLFSLSVLFFALVLTGCSGEETPSPDTSATGTMEMPVVNEAHAGFFNHLQNLCGETFTGQSTFPDDTSHPLVGTELRTHISECTENMVRIELIRDGDYWHGAWVIEKREEGMHLFHDHLGDVRTMDELGEGDYHGYGGFAAAEGTDTQIFFPADDVTAEIIPEAATNVWMMQLDLEADRFIYYLERHDAPRFRAELTRVDS